MNARWARWVAVAVIAAVVWVATVVLAVTIADDDAGAEGAQSQERVASEDDYDVEVAECSLPGEQQDDEAGPAPTRLVSGTVTNTTDETRSFRIPVDFDDPDGIRVDQAAAIVDDLGPGGTARWEAASYGDQAGAHDVACEVGDVSYVQPGEEFPLSGAGPEIPPVVYSTTDNTDDGRAGDVGDIDAVTYVCYVVNPRVPVTCGTVSN